MSCNLKIAEDTGAADLVSLTERKIWFHPNLTYSNAIKESLKNLGFTFGLWDGDPESCRFAEAPDKDSFTLFAKDVKRRFLTTVGIWRPSREELIDQIENSIPENLRNSPLRREKSGLPTDREHLEKSYSSLISSENITYTHIPLMICYMASTLGHSNFWFRRGSETSRQSSTTPNQSNTPKGIEQ